MAFDTVAMIVCVVAVCALAAAIWWHGETPTKIGRVAEWTLAAIAGLAIFVWAMGGPL
jgi:hypothetical protein